MRNHKKIKKFNNADSGTIIQTHQIQETPS